MNKKLANIVKEEMKKQAVTEKQLEDKAQEIADRLHKEDGYPEIKVSPYWAYGKYGFYFEFNDEEGRLKQAKVDLGTKKECMEGLNNLYYKLADNPDWWLRRGKQANKQAKTQTISIDDLWTYACGGEIDKLKEYYDNGGKPNRKYHRFDHDHSLIMGALRNGEYETVDFLKQNGETIYPEEEYEFKELMEYRNNKKSFKGKKLSKIAKAKYTQRQLKEMVADGVAIDITTWSTSDVYKLQKEEQLEPIGSSYGVYGPNGRLYRGKSGKLYAVTARNNTLDQLPW